MKTDHRLSFKTLGHMFGHRHRHAHGGFGPPERREHRHHRGHRRMFDHGELRLVILALIAEKPRHGYEIIKAIEERLGGEYSPSPGVIYPTLTMLEELGHIEVAAAAEGGRRLSTVTEAGRAWLLANEAAVKSALDRMGQARGAAGGGPPAPVARAMENLKTALRLRLEGPALNATQAEALAAALDLAAQHVERI